MPSHSSHVYKATLSVWLIQWYSYWQLLESLAKSMSSFLPSLSQSSGCCGNARFAVVGTFADRIDECASESLEDKNTSLAQSLKAYERLRINYKGKAILPINAVTSDNADKKQRRQYMMELRRHIARSPSVEVTIKLRSQAWLDPSRLRMGQETLVSSSCTLCLKRGKPIRLQQRSRHVRVGGNLTNMWRDCAITLKTRDANETATE